MLVLSRFEQHEIKNATENYCRYVLHINPKFEGNARLFSLLFNRPEDFSNIIDMGDDAKNTESVIEKIIIETEENKKMSDTMTELLINQLLVYALRHTEFRVVDSSAFNGTEDTRNRVRRRNHAYISCVAACGKPVISFSRIQENNGRFGYELSAFMPHCRSEKQAYRHG